MSHRPDDPATPGNELAFQVSSTLAYLAHAMSVFSVATWCFDVTRSTSAAGLATFSILAPMLALGLLAGSLADRPGRVHARRSTLIRAQTVVALASAGLYGVSSADSSPALIEILVFGTLYGTALAFTPQTRLALIANVVRRERLGAATILVSVTNTAALAVGPAIAGVIDGVWGWPTVFATTATLWAVSTALMVGVQVSSPSPPGQAVRPPGVRAALRYLRSHQDVSALLAMIAVVIVFLFGPLQVLVPAFATAELNLSGARRGGLMAALGAGIFCGGFSALFLHRFAKPRQVLVASAVTATLSPILVAMSTSTTALVTALVFAGAAGGLFASSAPAMVQVAVSDDMRGRVMAFYVIIRWGLPAAGTVTAGLLSERVGLRPTLWCVAVVGVLGVLTSSRHARRQFAAKAEDERAARSPNAVPGVATSSAGAGTGAR
jgi:MFS family permease